MAALAAGRVPEHRRVPLFSVLVGALSPGGERGNGYRALWHVVAMVLGGHGDTMVPLPRYCSVSGVPLLSLMDQGTVDAIVKRVQGAGGEVVGLLKTGSAFVSPAQASIEMAESFLLDQKRVLPCAAYLEGEYGASGIYMGVPVQIGAGGIERIFELELNADERAMLDQSIEHVKTLLGGISL